MKGSGDKLYKGVQVHTGQRDDIDDTERLTYIQRATELNNKAFEADLAKNYPEAERLHTEALNLKLIAKGPNSITYALSLNALAETQIQLGKWDDAEKNLLDAVRIRELPEIVAAKPFDAAVSRDTLGQVYEYRGDLQKARETRMKFPARMSCGYYTCPMNDFAKLADLRCCGRCKAAFYCSTNCQKGDWRRHKAFCKAV